MDTLNDAVAIVTGGASGIGRALCEAMARRKAIVVTADIDKEAADNVAAAICTSGGRACAAHLDVTDAHQVRLLVEETAARYGRLDYMFNNAGIAILGEVRDMSAEHWRRILDVNLMGVVYGTTAAYSLMVRQGFGHIVNTASQAGLYPVAGTTAYATTKHGIVGLSTSLRAEGAGLGVKVTVVCPGPVKTGILPAATMLRIDKDEFISMMPGFMQMDVDKAARVILEGVMRNRPIIVLPFHARFFWWLYRINPTIVESFVRQTLKVFRKRFLQQ